MPCILAESCSNKGVVRQMSDDFTEIDDIGLLVQAMVGVVGVDKTKKVFECYKELEEQLEAEFMCCRCQEDVHVLKQVIVRLSARVDRLERIIRGWHG